MSALTSGAVERIILDCVWPDAEVEGWTTEQLVENSEVIEGIVNTYAFRPGKAEEHYDELLKMVNELPGEFIKASEGGKGGWTFLNLCMRADGEQWTDLHLVQERFACLCIAAGLASWVGPPELWQAMPGGVPFICFDPKGKFPKGGKNVNRP